MHNILICKHVQQLKAPLKWEGMNYIVSSWDFCNVNDNLISIFSSETGQFVVSNYQPRLNWSCRSVYNPTSKGSFIQDNAFILTNVDNSDKYRKFITILAFFLLATAGCSNNLAVR